MRAVGEGPGVGSDGDGGRMQSAGGKYEAAERARKYSGVGGTG